MSKFLINADEMLLHNAIEFATLAHKNQVRKTTDIPYIVHPFEVSLILQKAEFCVEVVVAGLLHDTVEDAGVTIDEIRNKFGERISELVAACSEDKSKTWEERKQHTIDFCNDCDDVDILALHCADKLANLRSIQSDFDKIQDKVFERFNRGKDKTAWYYDNLIDAFSERLNEYDMYSELRSIYQSLFIHNK